MSTTDVFHLGLVRDDLHGATLAIVPGDPERVEKIARLMDNPVPLASHREFTSWRDRKSHPAGNPGYGDHGAGRNYGNRCIIGCDSPFAGSRKCELIV
ncbi:hypothetical protein A0E43_03605 [Pectobacterium cacticida]